MLKVSDNLDVQRTSNIHETLGRLWIRLTPYVFISPFFISFIAFQLFPIIFSVVLSVSEWNPYVRKGSGLTFVGLDNFTKLFANSRFMSSLGVTASITIICTIVGTSLAILLAVLLDKAPERLSMILRAVFFMPSVTSVVVITYIWKQLLSTKHGSLNALLEGLGLERHDWLGSGHTALWAIIVMLVWSGLGWDALIIMSGLRSIPEEIYDAAKVDGANGWNEFWHLTLPLLRPTLLFVSTTGFIYLLGIFAPVQLLTNGGPVHRTETVALQLYHQSFELQEFGYASAIAVALTAIMLVVSILNKYLFGREVEY